MPVEFYERAKAKFTSHYVSINSEYRAVIVKSMKNLHPTMYLLIQNSPEANIPRKIKFTSHYVSINSNAVSIKSTLSSLFTSHYVSINSP